MSHVSLKVGLLNMMADGALRATERQFARLLPGTVDRPVAWLVFSLPELSRSSGAARYVRDHYQTFADVRQQGLDALVITGVNLSDPRLEVPPFWSPLAEVLNWAGQQVTSTLCSCLATHAVLQYRFGQVRNPWAPSCGASTRRMCETRVVL